MQPVLARCLASLVLAALIARASCAQERIAIDEFAALEPVLQAATKKAAPFVVTVETFGGVRRALGAEAAVDSSEPSRPMPKPKPKPKPRREDEEERDDKRPLVPTQGTGFQQTQGRSTGLVVGADGWILVSRFCLSYDPTTILVTIPGGATYHATRKGEDQSRGIALLKIEAEGLATPTMIAPDTVRVGQWAFVLGRTFGATEPTVHFGIVSATRRQFGRALQIDASTSPANYGGAVIDVDGNVLGIAVPLSPAGRNAGAEWYDSGIGFCATVADIAPLIERMKQGEVLQRGWLGVTLEASHLGPGAKLSGTPKDGPAAQSGLRKGDIITSIDGVAVRNGAHLQMLVGARMAGESIALVVQKKREETPLSVSVTLADLPGSADEDNGPVELPAGFPVPEEKK
jgi:S1-C subfamily serine protease